MIPAGRHELRSRAEGTDKGPELSAAGVVCEPGPDLAGVLVGWEDGVEHVLDSPVAHDKGLTTVERHPTGGEGRQVERVRERQPEALDELGLVGAGLGRQAVDRGGAGGEQVDVVVAEVAGLVGAAAGAGDGVPALGQIDVSAPGER